VRTLSTPFPKPAVSLGKEYRPEQTGIAAQLFGVLAPEDAAETGFPVGQPSAAPT
jgi:hypothetical protein